MSPLKRWGHLDSPLSAQFVRSVFVCAFSPPIWRRSNTRRWPNAGLMYCVTVLCYRFVFGAMLHVGQRHRRRANINPALIQSIMPVVQPAWSRPTDYGWMNTSDAGSTFNRHWVDVGLHCQTRSPANTRRWTSAGFMLGQRRRRWARIGPALGQSIVFAGSVDRPHLCFAHHRCEDIKTVTQLIEPKDDLDDLLSIIFPAANLDTARLQG